MKGRNGGGGWGDPLYYDPLFYYLSSGLVCFVVLIIILIVLFYSIKSNRDSSQVLPEIPSRRDYALAAYNLEKTRKKVILMPKIIHGTLIFIGFITLLSGIILANLTNNTGVIVSGAFEALVGGFIIFFSFNQYKTKIKKIAENILPEIEGEEKS